MISARVFLLGLHLVNQHNYRGVNTVTQSTELAYFLDGKALITLQGTAKIIAPDGEVVRELDLSTLDVPIAISQNISIMPDIRHHCDITFTISNIFQAPT